jgi:hypothetical protein
MERSGRQGLRLVTGTTARRGALSDNTTDTADTEINNKIREAGVLGGGAAVGSEGVLLPGLR